MLTRLLLALTTAALLSPPADACSCALRGYDEAAIRSAVYRSDAVFIGIVIHAEDVQVPDFAPDPGLNPARLAVFDVETTWKGGSLRRTTVFSGDGRSDCGFVFEKGKEYLVFANMGGPFMPGALNTSNCTHTAAREEALKVVVHLGEPLPPPTPWPGRQR